ncbi:Antibiotic biosynthesis monooxygenase [Colwellia chukchiensis]|uniref:Antibiotic biosynthesis monooxygenase n=1 Tax=Colwellia chukchiensis TaxID=641665 RepID=A0A1H7QKK9_9GAMM|nr:antibiotic biosynthesis monooxygenase family protein [Colwellia chukchiensis]SEL48661.1 Antibiotic biosynthesis monooxygenase [Colwellia chukchiensis]
MNIVRVNEFVAAAGKSAELFRFLQSLVPYISAAKGCISCELLKHHQHGDQFMIIERWDCIESHQLALTNYPQDDMQAAMSLFGSPPKGNYFRSCAGA